MKTTLKSVYMDIYWPGDTLLVSNVAREAKRVAHPWSRGSVDVIKVKFYGL